MKVTLGKMKEKKLLFWFFFISHYPSLFLIQLFLPFLVMVIAKWPLCLYLSPQALQSYFHPVLEGWEQLGRHQAASQQPSTITNWLKQAAYIIMSLLNWGSVLDLWFFLPITSIFHVRLSIAQDKNARQLHIIS